MKCQTRLCSSRVWDTSGKINLLLYKKDSNNNQRHHLIVMNPKRRIYRLGHRLAFYQAASLPLLSLASNIPTMHPLSTDPFETRQVMIELHDQACRYAPVAYDWKVTQRRSVKR
jgi:hypothetical protein